MSTKTDGVTVLSIHGRDYSFKAPQGKQDALRDAAERLNKVLAETKSAAPLLDSDQLLVLTALNLCAQLIDGQQSEQAAQSTEAAVTARLDGLAQLIQRQLQA